MKPQDVDKYTEHEFLLAEQGAYEGELETIPMEISGATVLDLGAGPGIWCRFFAEAGAKSVMWIDNSSRFLKHARTYLKSFSNTTFTVADMVAIPAQAEVFDLVYCRGALHHSIDEGETIREIARVLKPGGLVAISTFGAARVTREVPMGWKKPFHYVTPIAARIFGRKIATTLYNIRSVVERQICDAGLEIIGQDDTDPVVSWTYASKPSGQEATATPLVSVIIPTYNRANLCLAAVRSVLAQTWRPVEVIVVDDGSTDRTPELFANAKPPVRYIRQENSERAAARNVGVAAAEGEFVAFLDSDDFWSRKHLEHSVDMLLRNPKAALVYGRAIYTTARGTPLREAPSPKTRAGFVTSDKAIDAMATSVVPFPLSSVVARRDVLLEHRFNEDRALARSEDWELWVRIASRFPVASTGEPTTFLRIHEGNTSQEVDSVSRAMGRAYDLALEDEIASVAIEQYRKVLRAAMELELARLNAMVGRKDRVRAALRLIESDGGERIDRRAVLRLKAMLVLPVPLTASIRYLTRLAAAARGAWSGRRIRNELRALNSMPEV